ncbi:MAG: amidohydrolase family protein [Abditibacteriaceae bacterium]
MALIDLLCHYGVLQETLSLNTASAEDAKAYADRMKLDTLCFISSEAALDLDGGNAHLQKLLNSDTRFRGWLTLSQHQLDLSTKLAHENLTKPQWIGVAFSQSNDGDSVNTENGIELINSLRRFGRPILLTVTSPHTLDAAIAVAKAINHLRFIIAPQSASLTSNAIPAMKSILNLSLLPSVQFAERDVIAEAVEAIGERRILWGSDWGICNPTAAMGMIKDSAITTSARERIAFRNASELLK